MFGFGPRSPQHFRRRLLLPNGARPLPATGTEGLKCLTWRLLLAQGLLGNKIWCDSRKCPNRQDARRRSDLSHGDGLELKGVASGLDSGRSEERQLPGQDSNLDKENQNLLCYRYTTGYRGLAASQAAELYQEC